jgi:DNA-binding GntR family transcriptional regulator
MMANVSRESVSRALQLLIKQGVVEKDHRRLIVLQPKVLQTMASGAEEPPQAKPNAGAEALVSAVHPVSPAPSA